MVLDDFAYCVWCHSSDSADVVRFLAEPDREQLLRRRSQAVPLFGHRLTSRWRFFPQLGSHYLSKVRQGQLENEPVSVPAGPMTNNSADKSLSLSSQLVTSFGGKPVG